MEVIELLTNVKSLNDYVSITQDMMKNISNLKVQFGMTTLLALKNIGSLELEYFKKYSKSGAATIIFELLLRLPASKTWSVIGKELVTLIQYWLYALRKHLIINSEHWWKFLSIILSFIQQLYLKHISIVTWLVEKTGECLLHLATRSEPSIEQRYLILQCFNKYSGLATRELRNELKNKFEIYFIQLASHLSACDDVCVQFAIVETLVRWLVPRQDAKAREDAANRWFPSTLYTNEAVQVFVERCWLSFFKDSRSFLNAVNESNDGVVSVLCEKFFVGNFPLVTGRRNHWLDLNCGSHSISLMLESTLYRALKVPNPNEAVCGALSMTNANTDTAKMYSGPRGLLLSLKIIDPLQMFPSKVLENNYDVKIIISSESDIQRVDTAMRNIFDKKYQLLSSTDPSLEALELSQSSDRDRRESSRFIDYISEEDTRFSNPPEILRRKLLEQRALSSRQSPSSVSTSSLVLLGERLKAFPDCQFDKEVERVSARPQLQSVTEVTETEECQSHSSLSTAKLDLRAAGPSRTNSQSQMSSPKSGELQNTQGRKDENFNNTITPNKNIAPANIIDLLAQEALQYSRLEDTRNTHDQSTDVVDKISATKTKSRRCDKREYNHKPTLICDVTTDESSTAFVENTPAVHVKTTKRISKVTRREKETTKDSKDSGFGQQTFDNKTIETFFSQHCSENKHGDLIISPTLARKLNDSNTESSESFTLCRPVNTETAFNFNFMEVIECLNSVIDIVCEDFDRHVEHLSQHLDQNNILYTDTIEAGLRKVPLEEVTNVIVEDKKRPAKKRKTKQVQGIKLKFKNTKTKRSMPNKNKKEKNTQIEEIVNDLDKTSLSVNNTVHDLSKKKSTNNELETPVNKRKRKLYSPKDDDLINAKVGIHVSETEEDNSILVESKIVHISPVPTATPYKELEKLRKNAAARQLRNRKSEVVCPKTAKMHSMFDQLQKTDNNKETIVLVNKKSGDKAAVYNFTSSSEDDEDFKIKKAVTRNTSKKISHGRNEPKIISVAKGNSKDKQTIAKRTRSKSKQQMSKKSVTHKPTRELVDERMRETNEVLNTSLVIEFCKQEVDIELQPAHKKPRMEIVPDDEECEIATVPLKKTEKRNRNIMQRSKGRKTNKLVITNKTDDDTKTISPLPGLEIETAQKMVEADNSIIMLERLDDKYEGNLHVLDLTQNLLSESEQVNNSPPEFNITDELKKATVNIKKRSKSKIDTTLIESERLGNVRSISCSSSSNESANKKLVVVLDKLDIHSGKSILTTGRSPITAHGVFDECPPQLNEIQRQIKPRSLETQNFSEDVIDYYNKLTNEINASTDNRCSLRYNNSQESKSAKSSSDRTLHSNNSQKSKNSEKSGSVLETSPQKYNKIIVERSPSVSITRLSQKEIERYIASRNCVSPVMSSPYSKSEDSKPNESNKNKKNAQKVRKSTISPILLKDFNIKEKSVSSVKSNRSKTVDTCLEIEKPHFDSNRYNLRKYGKRYRDKSKSPSVIDSSEVRVLDSSKVRSEDKVVIMSISEKEKPDTKNTLSAANRIQPSSSSVDNWFFRNELREKSSAEETTLKDVLSIVQEKLDTTLHEIHLNTSKSLIKMLAQTHDMLNRTREERATLVHQTVTDLVSAFGGIVNGKFSKLEKTLQEKDENVIADFKTVTRSIIIDEARKKREFVKLLKGDISAAMRHTTRQDDEDNDDDDDRDD